MSKPLEQPIIFLGFGRCGSTIISEIIFQHHKLAWVSNYQEKFPNSTKINLLRNVFDNRFWRFSGQKNQLNKVSLFNKYIFRPSEPYSFWNQITGRNFRRSFLYRIEEEPAKIDEIRSFFSKIVKYQNRERLGFKITGPARLTYLHSIFPDARYIYIKRAPLPNLRSLLNVYFYQDRKYELTWKQEDIYSEMEKKMIEKWKVNKPSFIAALQYYKVYNIYNKEKKELFIESSILEISYEDFITMPDKTVSTILEFVGLDKDKAILKWLEENIIYDRNDIKDFFISPDLDNEIRNIAKNGI